MDYRAGIEQQTEWLRRPIAITLLAVLLIGLFQVFSPFLTPILWAVITSLSVWPLNRWFRARFRGNRTLSAFAMTFTLAIVFFGILVPIFATLATELNELGKGLRSKEGNFSEEIATAVEGIPMVGTRLGGKLRERAAQLQEDDELLSHYEQHIVRFATSAARGALTALAELGIFFLVCFFLFRDGASLGVQLETVVMWLGGPRFRKILETMRLTVRGSVYGMLATALAQGTLAGLGYWAAGAPVPILLGCATMVLSLIPFGAPIVYVPACLAVFSQGHTLEAVLLLAWGMGVVSTIDNVLRPLFISQATNMSVLLVFFGVIGGVIAFGMLGIFIGPILIAVAQALWTEALEGSIKSDSTLASG